jgi:hypothetical protein
MPDTFAFGDSVSPYAQSTLRGWRGKNVVGLSRMTGASKFLGARATIRVVRIRVASQNSHSGTHNQVGPIRTHNSDKPLFTSQPVPPLRSHWVLFLCSLWSA